MKAIVYNRNIDKGVSVCWPSEEVIRWMGCGGVWNDKPRGYIDIQIERFIAAGHLPDAAARFARAVHFGGCTTAEALELVRDRDCAHLGHAIELWDSSNISTDRWFRNAWRRSHNGGPISIDLNLAKPIQFRRIHDAVAIENKRRSENIDSFDDMLEIDFAKIREEIRRSDDERVLRRIWPKELMR